MLLAPLRRSFKRHGAYLLGLPSAAVRPGALLDPGGQLFDDLLEVDAIWDGVIPVVEQADGRFLVDKTSFSIAGGGELGVGLPRIGSARAVLQGSRVVHVEIRGVTIRRARAEGIEHAADWIRRLNQHLDDPWLEVSLDLLKRRRAGWPAPRALDLAEATVHVDEIVFTSDAAGDAGLQAEVERALPVDIEAGFDVQWSRSAELVWRAGDVPIAYLPVRYAWAPRRERFVGALI